MRKRDLKALDKQQQKEPLVALEKQKVQVTEEILLPENVHIWVKDMETLNLYETFVELEQNAIKKLEKWIKSRKFSFVEHATDDRLTLKVKILTFQLYHHVNHP